jgi:sulfate transport system substrate-binding protein
MRMVPVVNPALKIAVLLALTSHLAACGGAADKASILNVSYDSTREFYEAYNQLFIAHWKEKTGQDVAIQQSHGGSGRQARSVIEGLPADVVTLALAYDIDAIAAKAKLLPADWQQQFPNNSTPYSSTIVFVVRRGNPKNIRDWDDLLRPGLQVITPNPKTSGGARWNYLAAWAYALDRYRGNEAAAKDYLRGLYANVPVLDTGARGATMTFVQRAIGDVLIAWESEALLTHDRLGPDKLEIVVPSISVLAEPPVAVVETRARRHGTLELANAYLRYLYSAEAQELVARNYYRPNLPEVAARYARQFPKLRLRSIGDLGGWKAVQAKHFDDNGVFDQISPH